MSRRDALRLIGGATLSVAAGAPGAAIEPGTLLVEAMRSRKIPSSGEALPVIGLGTWQTFDVGPSTTARAPLKEVLRTFASMGGKLIDSSPMYGSSEEVAGDLIAELGLQSKLFVATKVWTSGRKAGIEQMEDSMRKLRTPRLDLMQVHNLIDVDTQLDTLQQWKRDGRIRYVGITHYTASAYEAVARVMKSHPLDFLQINYSVGEREAEKRLLPLAQERGVAIIANRPFGGGGLFSRLRGKPLPAFATKIDCESWAQLLLKFVVSHPAITCAIPATSKDEHLRDNMGAGYGRLPDERLRARIAAAVDA
jgi:diketogulonate reductase-like aldo/keto reductase